jgi:hypothetical protein
VAAANAGASFPEFQYEMRRCRERFDRQRNCHPRPAHKFKKNLSGLVPPIWFAGGCATAWEEPTPQTDATSHHPLTPIPVGTE